MPDPASPVAASAADLLIGVWELEHADASLGLAPGSLTMFLPTGELRHASPTAEGMAVALLRYRVDGAWIISDQPSAPKEERTAFRFDGGDRLVLSYEAGEAHFHRVGQDWRIRRLTLR